MNSEGALLNRIKAAVLSAGAKGAGPVRLGIGDDAAILRPRQGRELILSSDFLIEGVHFNASHLPDAIGYKALARGVSDLAAMGANPIGFLLNLAMPSSRTGTWLDEFLAGMNRAARLFRIQLIGGDLSRDSKVAACVVVLGDVARGQAIPRSGARPGDRIYVSGKLGAARLGLEIILQRLHKRRDAGPLLKPHLYPAPRLVLGCWLARHRVAISMMDMSDGLSLDLTRLCEASKVGAVVYANRIPAVSIPQTWQQRLHLRPTSALDFALNGGDDYELLFTVSPRHEALLSRGPREPRLTRIGEITRTRKLVLVDRGKKSPLKPRGWDHFQ